MVSITRSRFRKRRAGKRTDCAPPVMVERAMSEHLEILGVVAGLGSRVVESMSQANALNGRLGHTADRRGRLDLQGFEHGGKHVEGMGILMTDLAF